MSLSKHVKVFFCSCCHDSLHPNNSVEFQTRTSTRELGDDTTVKKRKLLLRKLILICVCVLCRKIKKNNGTVCNTSETVGI